MPVLVLSASHILPLGGPGTLLVGKVAAGSVVLDKHDVALRRATEARKVNHDFLRDRQVVCLVGIVQLYVDLH